MSSVGKANQKIQTLNFVLYFHVIISIYVVFFFLSVSIRCLTKGKLKKRKHGKHIFLKQYAFQTKGSSAVGVSCESKLTGQSWRGGQGWGVQSQRPVHPAPVCFASSILITKYFFFLLIFFFPFHFASSREIFFQRPPLREIFLPWIPALTQRILYFPPLLLSFVLLHTFTPPSHLSHTSLVTMILSIAG